MSHLAYMSKLDLWVHDKGAVELQREMIYVCCIILSLRRATNHTIRYGTIPVMYRSVSYQ